MFNAEMTLVAGSEPITLTKHRIMTDEEKELLLKALCGYLPYGVMCDRLGKPCKLVLVDIERGEVRIKKDENRCPVLYSITRGDGILPYLRPMSSMTEEEKDELYTVMDWYGGIDENGNVDTNGQDKVYRETFYDYTDWLNAHHFDYRGLIEKGLALEAPEGMYES